MITALDYIEKEAGIKKFVSGAKRVMSGSNIDDAIIGAAKRGSTAARRASLKHIPDSINEGNFDKHLEMIRRKVKLQRKILDQGDNKIKKEKVKTYGSRALAGIAGVGTAGASVAGGIEIAKRRTGMKK